MGTSPAWNTFTVGINVSGGLGSPAVSAGGGVGQSTLRSTPIPTARRGLIDLAINQSSLGLSNVWRLTKSYPKIGS